MPPWRDAPADVRPMLASLDEPPVVQRGLIYEPKYDGIRALVSLAPPAEKTGVSDVAIYSRNGHAKQRQFPEITAALASVARRLEGPLLADGEIVAIDPAGRPLGFQSIQGRIHLTAVGEIERVAGEHPAALILFDLLRDDDEDLRGLPLAARRLRLQDRVKPRGPERGVIRLSEIAADDGRPMLQRARDEGWEGLIVKDGQSRYSSGRRTPAWRKMKLLQQEGFVVGGWTDPRLSRSHFGALLLGQYDADGALRWVGSVGTGFDQPELERLAGLLQSRARASSPFADDFKTSTPAHWVTPSLVVEVRFTEWTAEGLLRHPVYLGTRSDKTAREILQKATSPAPRVKPRTQGMWYPTTRASAAAPAAPVPRQARKKAASAADTGLEDVVRQLDDLEDARRDGDLALPNGDRVRVSNLRKVFWPDLGITKGELLRFYVRVSPWLLPAVADRPLVMKRFPNGVGGQAFYQQRHPETPPAGVRREILPPDIDPPDEDGPRDRLIGGSLTTLLYMTQLAAISQDPWFSRAQDAWHQDYAAIDLDPDDDTDFAGVLDVARWVKDELDRHRIPAVAKTSGASGLHIYIPLGPRTTYETGQLLCQIIATAVATKHPKAATIERAVKKRRRGTVYVDYLQNILGKTLATAYSARASDYAGVSTPLSWDEVARGVNPRDFTVRTALARFKEVGDLWAPIHTGKRVDLRAVLRGAG